jgi:hypothetical protein
VTLAGIIGVLLGMAILPFTMKRVTMSRVAFAFILLAIHIAAAVAYYFYTVAAPADANFYYFAEDFFRRLPITALSTAFIGHFAQFTKTYLGATYLDCFLIFQAFGFWGIMILWRTFQEIHERTHSIETSLPSYMLLLPTLQFWTSAVGKDGLMLLGISLSVWSALDLSKRKIGFAVALALMVVVRAHIAFVAVIAVCIASLSYRNLSAGRKGALLLLAVGGAILVGSTIDDTFHVNVSDPESLSLFLEKRSAAELASTSGTSIAQASFFIRMISLLFRPLFFDASGIPAIFASFENVGSIFLFVYLFKHFREIRLLIQRVFFVRFVVFLTVSLILTLSFANYNIGLGLRQRLMIVPPLFSIFVSVWALRHRVPPQIVEWPVAVARTRVENSV